MNRNSNLHVLGHFCYPRSFWNLCSRTESWSSLYRNVEELYRFFDSDDSRFLYLELLGKCRSYYGRRSCM